MPTKTAALEKIEIRNRFTGEVQVTAEIETTPSMTPRVKLGLAMIYMASDPGLEKIPDFYATNDEALADMKRLAEQEAA